MNTIDRQQSGRSANSLEGAQGIAEPEVAQHEQAVLNVIREMAYGTIEVTIHQSRIVQITRSEKLRL
jgi:hypothetical protein